MKKTIIAMILALFMTGCGNMQVVDFKYTFEQAIVKLPDGTVVEGKVTAWRDYEDSDAVQVTIDGKTYLTHYCNVTLIHEEWNAHDKTD